MLVPLLEKAGIINIGICSNTDVAKGKFNFVNYLTAEQGVDKFLREMDVRYPRGAQLSIFSLNETGFNFIVERLQSKQDVYGTKIAAVEVFEPRTTDFRSQITRVLKGKPDVLLILGLSPEIEVLGRQLRELGHKLPLVSIEGFGLSENKKIFEDSWFVDAPFPTKILAIDFSLGMTERLRRVPGIPMIV